MFLLHGNETLARTLTRAVQGKFRVRRLGDWPSLHECAPALTRRDLIVVDPYLDSPAGVSPACVDLLLRFPSAMVLGVLNPRAGYLQDVLMLGSRGMREVIDVAELASEGLVRQRLGQLRGGLGSRELLGPLEERLTPRGRAIVQAATVVAAEQGGVRELARKLYLSQRSLLRWSHQAGLPPPRELLAWIRILSAAELLDDPGRTMRSVALVSGYSNEDALGAALAKRLGMRTRALQAAGAFQAATTAFRAAVAGRLAGVRS